eukprot:4853839-Amphidinium_carterae.1
MEQQSKHGATEQADQKGLGPVVRLRTFGNVSLISSSTAALTKWSMSLHVLITSPTSTKHIRLSVDTWLVRFAVVHSWLRKGADNAVERQAQELPNMLGRKAFADWWKDNTMT